MTSPREPGESETMPENVIQASEVEDGMGMISQPENQNIGQINCGMLNSQA
jgi:hypothetical protein